MSDPAISTTPPSPEEMAGETGTDGVELQGGRIRQNDYNVLLRPEQWRGRNGRMGIVDEMRRSYGLISACWAEISTLAASTRFRVIPASDAPVDIRIARFLEHAILRDTATPWPMIISSQAEVFPRGTDIQQISWRMREGLGTNVDGIARGVPVWTLGDVKQLPMRWVSGWVREIDSVTGASRWHVEIYSGAPGGGALLHPDQVVHTTWAADGASPEGIGALRSVHAPWRGLKSLGYLQLTGLERSAYGTPVAQPKEGTPPTNKKEMRKTMREMRAGKYEGTVVPAGWTLEDFKIAFDAEALEKAMRFLGGLILDSMACGHLRVGEAGAGAFNLHAARNLGTIGRVQNILNRIAAAWSHGPHSPFANLVRVNFGGRARVPRLEAGQVHNGDPKALLATMGKAVKDGMLVLGPKDEAYTRNVGMYPAADPRTVTGRDIGLNKVAEDGIAPTPVKTTVERESEAETPVGEELGREPPSEDG